MHAEEILAAECTLKRSVDFRALEAWKMALEINNNTTILWLDPILIYQRSWRICLLITLRKSMLQRVSVLILWITINHFWIRRMFSRHLWLLQPMLQDFKPNIVNKRHFGAQVLVKNTLLAEIITQKVRAPIHQASNQQMWLRTWPDPSCNLQVQPGQWAQLKLLQPIHQRLHHFKIIKECWISNIIIWSSHLLENVGRKEIRCFRPARCRRIIHKEKKKVSWICLLCYYWYNYSVGNWLDLEEHNQDAEEQSQIWEEHSAKT